MCCGTMLTSLGKAQMPPSTSFAFRAVSGFAPNEIVAPNTPPPPPVNIAESYKKPGYIWPTSDGSHIDLRELPD